MPFPYYGTEGNDRVVLFSDTYNEFFLGGGDDTLLASTSIGIVVYCGAGNDIVGMRTGNQFTWTRGSDIFYGEGGNDSLNGGYSGDYIDGGEGNDYITSGDSSGDRLYGGPGDDIITNEAAERAPTPTNLYMHGGDGADLLSGGRWLWGDGGDDIMFGELMYSNAGVLLTNYVYAEGGDGADYIDTHFIRADVYGGAGNDTIRGAGYLDGGDGDDHIVIVEQTGFVVVAHTGSGLADLVIGSAQGEVVVADGSGFAIVEAGAGGDALMASTSKQVEFYGEAGADTLEGGGLADWLSGGEESDALYGGGGADWLLGGAGSDFINAGGGSDKIWGGSEADTFFFGADSLAGGDVELLMDFENGTDVIALPAAYQGAVNISASAYGSYVWIALGGGAYWGMVVEGVQPGDLTIGGDFIFV